MKKQNRTDSIVKYSAVTIAVFLVLLGIGAVVTDTTPALNYGQTQQKAQTFAGPSQNTASGDAQEVFVSMKGYTYTPNPIIVKRNVPVRLTIDLDNVYGCMRSIVIPEFGVRKLVREGDNVIEFTPTKAGTFTMQCSMGMGQGKIVVEDDDGTVPQNIETPVAASQPSGTCRMASGGGCGCGGAR